MGCVYLGRNSVLDHCYKCLRIEQDPFRILIRNGTLTSILRNVVVRIIHVLDPVHRILGLINFSTVACDPRNVIIRNIYV